MIITPPATPPSSSASPMIFTPPMSPVPSTKPPAARALQTITATSNKTISSKTTIAKTPPPTKTTYPPTPQSTPHFPTAAQSHLLLASPAAPPSPENQNNPPLKHLTPATTTNLRKHLTPETTATPHKPHPPPPTECPSCQPKWKRRREAQKNLWPWWIRSVPGNSSSSCGGVL